MNSEEAFILASLKEFVKAWGSGSQASFNLDCKQGQVYFKMSSLLGHPGAQHFVPAQAHGNHDHVDQTNGRRRKGPSKILRDRACAAAHRATLIPPRTDNSADTVAEVTESAASAGSPPTQATPASPPPAVTAGLPPSAPEGSSQSPPPPSPLHAADPATLSHTTLDVAVSATDEMPEEPTVETEELSDEVVTVPQVQAVPEFVQVYCTATFDNCPTAELSQDYADSLMRYLRSEPHLEQNIVNAELKHLSCRSFRNSVFVHTVDVIILVRCARLWESPASYVRKFLAHPNLWEKV